MLRIENAIMDITNGKQELPEEEPVEHLVQLTTVRLNDDSGCSTSQQEVINEDDAISVHAVSNTPENYEKLTPELSRRVSRTEAVKQDAMKLKTATLDRMGRMFKQRTKTPTVENTPIDTNNAGSQQDLASRKQKTNSLGRMFKLVDKDGSPKKLFVPPRSGSLSRLLRRHPPETENGPSKKNTSENTPGMFSRMLNQLRGKYRSIEMV